MQTLNTGPIKIRKFRPRADTYYIGLDGIFIPEANQQYINQFFIKKLIQIKTYCRKFGKKVAAIVNTRTVPKFLIECLYSMSIPIISVIMDKQQDTLYGNYFVRQEPTAFIARHVEVVFIVKPLATDVEFELETDTPVHTVVYPAMKVVNPRLIEDPRVPVADHEQKRLDNNSPYFAFDLLKQGRERITDDYYDRVTKAPQPSAGPAPLRMKNQQK